MNPAGTELEKYQPRGRGLEKYVPPPRQQEPVLGKRDLLTILFKHKSRILGIFLGTVAVFTLTAFLLPPTYEARSSLMVKFGREYVNRSGAGDRPSILALNQEEMLNSEIQILTSRDLTEWVLSDLKVETVYPGLAKSPPKNMTPLGAATLEAGKKLAVEGVKKSNVIEVAFQHEDPRVAARFVNRLIEFYKMKHLQIFSDPQSSFIDTQLEKYVQKLKLAENQMEEFKQKNRVFSLEEQRSLLLNQRVALDTDSKKTQNQVDELTKRLSSLRRLKEGQDGDKSIYITTERDRIIVDARARLLSLQLQEQGLLKQYNEGNRLVRNVQDEIQLVQKFLKDQESEISGKVRTGNPVYQEVEMDLIRTQAELSSQTAKAAALQGQLAKVDREIQSINLLENEHQGLKRGMETNEKNYRIYMERQEEARISDEMNRLKMANISVITPATVPLEKIKPKRVLIVLMGILAGIVAGLGFALFSENSSQRFSSPEIAEKRLGLPVLTTIMHKE